MAADIFTDICRFPEELDVGLPQRLQTSMSLYSNNLSGLVLLTDDACMSLENSKMTNEFNKLCNQSTEFHFPSFEQQLESIRNEHLEVSFYFIIQFLTSLWTSFPPIMGIDRLNLNGKRHGILSLF